MIFASVVKGAELRGCAASLAPRSIAGIASLRATGKPATLPLAIGLSGTGMEDGALRARRLIHQNPGIPGLLPESWFGSPEEEMRTDARCARIDRGPSSLRYSFYQKPEDSPGEKPWRVLPHVSFGTSSRASRRPVACDVAPAPVRCPCHYDKTGTYAIARRFMAVADK